MDLDFIPKYLILWLLLWAAFLAAFAYSCCCSIEAPLISSWAPNAAELMSPRHRLFVCFSFGYGFCLVAWLISGLLECRSLDFSLHSSMLFVNRNVFFCLGSTSFSHTALTLTRTSNAMLMAAIKPGVLGCSWSWGLFPYFCEVPGQRQLLHWLPSDRPTPKQHTHAQS